MHRRSSSSSAECYSKHVRDLKRSLQIQVDVVLLAIQCDWKSVVSYSV